MRRVLMFVVLAMMLSACSGKAPGPAAASAPPRPLAQVSTLPGDKATGVSPTLPVAVRVTGGDLQQVALTNAEGKAVAGTLSEDRHSWLSTEPLGYGKAYTWSGSAAGPDHLPVPVTGSFTTVEPQRLLHATLN
ncbi:MAG: Ig-like domain-containing protein, partial [Pseudonocardiaceae bacterium]